MGKKVEIFVKDDPHYDDKSTLVFRSKDGKFHRVHGCYPSEKLDIEGWRKVNAIKTKIEGRTNEIFLEV